MIFIDQALLVFLAISLTIVVAITSYLITSRIFQNRIRTLEYAVSVQRQLLFIMEHDDEDEPTEDRSL